MKTNFWAGIFLISWLMVYTAQAQVKIITYPSSPEDIANPERGFYIPLDEPPGALTVAELMKYRNLPAGKNLPAKAKYSARVSLIYRGYLLSSFKAAALSADFLQQLEQDFQTVRQAGFKVILRFAYTNSAKSGNCPGKDKICPPYGDAPKHWVLAHIAQLKPVLSKNADIIAVMQQGFIGIWGENYYTDYFGDAATNPLGIIADSSWRDRNEVLQALLAALPADRIIQVRTPQIKQRYVYGPKAPVSVVALTESEAFNATDQARIGLHNDCFLAGPDDYGTFYDYGNSTSPPGPANETLRRYFAAESRYVAVGGETCDDAFSPANDCAPAGQAEQEMAGMHYSYLNAFYNNQVNNDWVKGGCLDNIKRKLGYRLLLKSARLPASAPAGTNLALTLALENSGYAAPFNSRPVQLVLRNKTSGAVSCLLLPSEIRQWYPGMITLRALLPLPATLVKGEYELLLNLPDPYESIAHRPEYSIRLANQGTWEPQTGYNQLLHTLRIH